MRLCKCPVDPDALPWRTAKALHAEHGFHWFWRTRLGLLISRIKYGRCLFCGANKIK